MRFGGNQRRKSKEEINGDADRYNAAGRLVSANDALGDSDRYVYNSAGEMIAYRDVLGKYTPIRRPSHK